MGATGTKVKGRLPRLQTLAPLSGAGFSPLPDFLQRPDHGRQDWFLLSLLGGAAVRGLPVITAQPVHAVLYLILAFSQAAAVWLLLKAEFLAIALVLVYLGAVMVLFLFVVMMLTWTSTPCAGGSGNISHWRLTIGAVIALEMAVAVLMGDSVAWKSPRRSLPWSTPPAIVVPYSNTRALGKLLYTQYLYPVEIAVAILVGGHGCCHRSDPASAQGQQGHQSFHADSCALRG